MKSMRRYLLSHYSVPVICLGMLVAVACLACSWYVNRLMADLARAVRKDAAAVEAIDALQLNLRHLRVHTLVLVSDRTNARWRIVNADLAHTDAALDAMLTTCSDPEDARLAEKIRRDYIAYRERLHLDHLPAPTAAMGDLARWSDEHHMEGLLGDCHLLAARQHHRMNETVIRSEFQTEQAETLLFGLGLLGVLSGLVSGYLIARSLKRSVAQLSVRVQAVQAHLGDEVGALTVQGVTGSDDLHEQLDHVVERVSDVCHKLQEQERSLLRAEKLAAVGRLAAGVAHEVKNPLTGLKLLLQAAARPQNPTPLTVERLELVLEEVARIDRTVQGLMDYSASPPSDLHRHDVCDIVRAALEVAQIRAEAKGVRQLAELPGASETIPILADRDRLLSLLTNLLFNAIDATPVGGEVRVSVELMAKSEVRVEVTDTGAGIDRQIASNLFTPFATTKATGTGLGLFVANQIAKEHGGTLTAAEAPRGGACFTLTLPVSKEFSHARTVDR